MLFLLFLLTIPFLALICGKKPPPPPKELPKKEETSPFKKETAETPMPPMASTQPTTPVANTLRERVSVLNAECSSLKTDNRSTARSKKNQKSQAKTPTATTEPTMEDTQVETEYTQRDN